MTADEALQFIERYGVVLEARRGPVPTLAAAIAGEPIRGSWWGHPKGHDIFAILSAVRASPDVLACRLIDRKVTLVHRRLWPALARLADELGEGRIAALREEHMPSGAHRTLSVPFRDWAPDSIWADAQALSEDEARAQMGAALAEY